MMSKAVLRQRGVDYLLNHSYKDGPKAQQRFLQLYSKFAQCTIAYPNAQPIKGNAIRINIIAGQEALRHSHNSITAQAFKQGNIMQWSNKIF